MDNGVNKNYQLEAMKKILILMLGLVTSAASFAKPSIPQATAAHARVVMTTDQKIILFVQPFHTKGQLAIHDASGQAVYTSTVFLRKGLRQQFDCSNLGIGTYRLTLTTGNEAITRTFVMQANPNQSFLVQ